MDKIISVLFNTNHEPPNFTVIVILVAVAFLASMLAEYIGRRRQNNRNRQAASRKKSGKK